MKMMNTKQELIDKLTGISKKDILIKLRHDFIEEDRKEPFMNREYVEETIRVFDMLIDGFDLSENVYDNAIQDVVSDIFRYFTGEI